MSVGLCHISCKAKRKREKTKQQKKNQKKTKKQHKKKQKKQKNKKIKNQTHESNRRLGSLGLVFFLVSWFLFFVFFGFLVFWFVVGFLKGWQSNAKVKDRDLALCQFSHFRGCFGPEVPLENHVKNHGKMQVSLEAWGAWDTD
jgi:hypothetical protein